MVVDDDDVGAERAGDRQRLDAGGAAVDRDDELGAVAGERLDGLAARAVALGHAVGDVDAGGEAVRGEEALQERGRAGAVDVVVAEHGDGLPAHDRIGQPRRALVHVAHGAGIGHQRLEGGVERHRHLVEADAARGEHPAQQLRQAVTLADGDGGLGGRGIEPLAPGKAARGHPHAEEGTGGIVCRNVPGNRAHRPRPSTPQAMLVGPGEERHRFARPLHSKLRARAGSAVSRGPRAGDWARSAPPATCPRRRPMPLKAAIVPVTPFQQNCTLLWDEASKRGAVVDPGGDLARIVAGIDKTGMVPEKILLTHGHLDHAGGAAELKEKLAGIPIEGPHEADKFLLDELAAQGLGMGMVGLRNVTPDRWLAEGDTVTVAGATFSVLHCPGPFAGLGGAHQRGAALCAGRRRAVPGLDRPHRFSLRRPRRADRGHQDQAAAAGRRHGLHLRARADEHLRRGAPEQSVHRGIVDLRRQPLLPIVPKARFQRAGDEG